MNAPGVAAILITFLVGLVMIAAGGWSRRIGALCLIGALAAGGFFFLRDRRIASGEEKIVVGDSQQRVLALLGSPTEITDCTTGSKDRYHGILLFGRIPVIPLQRPTRTDLPEPRRSGFRRAIVRAAPAPHRRDFGIPAPTIRR